MALASSEDERKLQNASVGRKFLGRGLQNRTLVFGLICLVFFTFIAIFAPVLATHDPLKSDAMSRLAPPSSRHIFGTDDFGRDILSRVIFGTRISMRVGIFTAIVASMAGVCIGALAGYYKLADAVLMRIMEGFMAFPGILLAIIVLASLGPSETNVVLAMSVVYMPRIARLLRAIVLQVKVMDFIAAARSAGAGDLRILVKHILPNCISPLLVQITFCFAWSVLVEAGLSFVGLGTPPPAPSWGTSVADSRSLVRAAPWTLLFPGTAIFFSVLSLNLVGDGLRDLLDTRTPKN